MITVFPRVVPAGTIDFNYWIDATSIRGRVLFFFIHVEIQATTYTSVYRLLYMAKSCVSYQRTIKITVVNYNFQLKRCIERSFLSYATRRQSSLPSAIVHRSVRTRADVHAGFIRGRILFQSSKTSMRRGF